MQKLRAGELVIVLAYGVVYRELASLLDEAKRRRVGTIFLTDTLADLLRRRVDLILRVARGRADMLSMHTATLGFLESLNEARRKLVGEPMAIAHTKRRRTRS